MHYTLEYLKSNFLHFKRNLKMLKLLKYLALFLKYVFQHSNQSLHLGMLFLRSNDQPISQVCISTFKWYQIPNEPSCFQTMWLQSNPIYVSQIHWDSKILLWYQMGFFTLKSPYKSTFPSKVPRDTLITHRSFAPQMWIKTFNCTS